MKQKSVGAWSFFFAAQSMFTQEYGPRCNYSKVLKEFKNLLSISKVSYAKKSYT